MASTSSITGFHRSGVNSGGINSTLRVGVVAAKQQRAVKSVRVKMAQSQSAASSSVSCSTSFYKVLSVPSDASTNDLKSAYRRLALQYHPDVCPAAEKEECTRRFVELQTAYETLSDPVLRQEYDWRLQNKLDLSDSEGRSEMKNRNLWEAQLLELIRRSNCRSENTWGGRMRRRKQRNPSASATI